MKLSMLCTAVYLWHREWKSETERESEHQAKINEANGMISAFVSALCIEYDLLLLLLL